jgi:hypothetical protein
MRMSGTVHLDEIAVIHAIVAADVAKRSTCGIVPDRLPFPHRVDISPAIFQRLFFKD